ncbi:hypothetical protein ES677_04440 [Bizionia gelidisalsuginis]|uniref:Uncharacterized protein n=1 Tax=Bizionia gelidisalsuginis TaxID=291188 RepID=A0ABY3MCF4_9FLAO|nr:hypothetical protein [Bizionia gelidisalsuginis]TYC15596.1 hypothetical protein ES677_04440 [Bizionia gelidisalsuginis]
MKNADLRVNEERNDSQSDLNLLNGVKGFLNYEDIEEFKKLFQEMFLITMRSDFADDTNFRNELATFYDAQMDLFKVASDFKAQTKP